MNDAEDKIIDELKALRVKYDTHLIDREYYWDRREELVRELVTIQNKRIKEITER